MAGTRLYFANDDVSPLPSLGFDAAWESNNARRTRLYHDKLSDEITTTTVAYTAGHDFCFVQATSSPLLAGQIIDTTWTVKGYIQAVEALAEDNVDRVLLGIRIVAGNGTTIRSTLLPVASYAGTAEFNLTTARAKQFADGDALQDTYVTAPGDRLVIELGFTDTTGVTPTAALALGMAEEDCPENETETNERAGWIEFSKVLYFVAEGPTRFWLPTAEASAVNPAFDGAWEDNDGAVRRKLRHVKDIADTLASGTAIVWTAGNDALDRQFVSDPMVAGQTFSPSVHLQAMVKALESATNDNVDQLKCGLRVFSEDGTTARATLIAVGNHSGLSPSELGTTAQFRRLANAKALETTYTTVDGDRLVFEVGFLDNAGASISATSTYGQSNGDAPYAFHGTTGTAAPWIELNMPIKFRPSTQRFYFSHSEPAAVEFTPDAEWEYISEIRFNRLRYFKDESNIQAGSTIGSWTAGTDAMDRQWVSDPMIAGIAFTTSVTVKMQLMVRETVTADDVTTAKLGLRVIAPDGTVRATLLPVANYSPTATEFPTVFTNKTWANGDALQANYTTQWGDRLVLEHGYRDAGTGSPDAASNLGCEAADLAENEVDTTNGAGWFEFTGVNVFFMGIHSGPHSLLPQRTVNMPTALLMR